MKCIFSHLLTLAMRIIPRHITCFFIFRDGLYDGTSVKERINFNLFSLPFIGKRKYIQIYFLFHTWSIVGLFIFQIFTGIIHFANFQTNVVFFQNRYDPHDIKWSMPNIMSILGLESVMTRWVLICGNKKKYWDCHIQVKS